MVVMRREKTKMDEQRMSAPGASWQRMAVWLARAGYSDLELSTVMTVQRLARRYPQPRVHPAVVAAARAEAVVASAPAPVFLMPELHAAAD